MISSMSRSRPSARKSDGTDGFFYWTIGGVVAVGLGANLYMTYTEEAPSLTTFLDLLKATKTHYCGPHGEVFNPSPAIISANCLDYNGYRIVQGPTTLIYEIRTGRPNSGDGPTLTKVAELNTTAVKRLFNLGNIDITYTIPEYPWP